ncbi:MAG: TonB-dependent receptor domain-containing protein [Gemmatimonadales bacterium]
MHHETCPIRMALALAILLAGAAPHASAQAGSLRGHVLRGEGPVGLAEAQIELRPTGLSTRTDARGFFQFRDVSPGRVELGVRRVGFAPAVVVVQVESLAVTEVDIRLEPVLTIHDLIVTSQTGDPQSLGEVAGAVSVADMSAIRRGRTVGLNETLRMMPGVQAPSRYGTEDVNLGIRGSAARARQAVRGVTMLIDGIPLSEPDGVGRPDLIDLAATKQVEVVRGPVSVLNAGSTGGVVNVVSRTGHDSPGVTGSALGGGFGFRKYDAQAGGEFADGKGSGFASGSYTWAEGYRAHSEADIARGQMAFDYSAAPGTRLFVQANGSQLDSRLPGSLTQAQFDTDPNSAAPSAVAFGVGRTDNRYRAGARLEQAVGSGTASGYFFYSWRNLHSPNAGEIVELDLDRIQGGARVRSGPIAGQALDATIGLDYDILYGTDRRWQNLGGAPGAVNDDGHYSVPNLGAYSQLQWRASRAAEATLGLRYDRVTYQYESKVGIPRQETAFDQLSPRLSVGWSTNEATALHASVGRGFETPAINELSASPGDSLSLSLHPKSLWNYEVGARRVIAGRVLLDGSVFYADVNGEFVPHIVNNVSRPENANHSRNIGVELGVTARATEQIELAASYTFLDLRLQDYTSAVLDSTGAVRQVDFSGKLMPGVPRDRVTGEVRLSPVAALDLGVQLEWQSLTYVETGNAAAGLWYFQSPAGALQQVAFRAAPARTLVHLNAAWRVGPATVLGSVENLFGLGYPGNIVANESLGRFYEAGSPGLVSLGLRVTTR